MHQGRRTTRPESHQQDLLDQDAAFGFSRGAALARAFCRDLQKRCREDSGVPEGWRLIAGGHPIEIAFLGIFDTVASCGLPPSVNNLSRNRYVKAVTSLGNLPLLAARAVVPPELKRLAFGTPGADPAPGLMDGHASWAKGMRVGRMVKHCFHPMSAHEHRNSFGLDSTLHWDEDKEKFYIPPGTVEMLYPGVHSDVGGGYRPGEGGCRNEKGGQLSLIALRAMHEEAIKYVPLRPLHALEDQGQREDFALDPEGSKHYEHMSALFKHYMSVAAAARVPGATAGLGGQINQHMRVYYAWRFRALRAAGSPAQKEQQGQVTTNERVFARDRAQLAADQKKAANEWSAATASSEARRAQLQDAYQRRHQFGTPVDPEQEAAYEAAKRRMEQKKSDYERLGARIDGAADDSELNAAIAKYDQMLLADARQIVEWMRADGSLRLRPHYAALVDAYLDEYERGRGLTDPQVIEFFNEYVHPSLAGFDKDETWPSDPRIVYVGGDNKLRYASAPPSMGSDSAIAAA